MPNPLPLGDVIPAGDLRRRAALNFARLHDAPFRFEAMVRANTAAEAPGDWIGRAMLGLSLLGQALDNEPQYLEEVIARLPSALNECGYIGPIHPAGTADENQVGGHNGLLRGLCEYYRWKRDPRALAVIRSVVAQLMLPARPLYAAYPDRPLAKLGAGQAIGLTVKHEGPWLGLSTDIGTVFFTLDGLTQAYTIEPTPPLRALIETMIARYAQLDIELIGAQTHSTLSTLRGIMRWWGEVDPRPDLLALVRARYQAYRARAESEHYANYNWFGRPEWTEACGVVDSFLLAVELWRATGEADYVAAAHRIYFNALSYAQRPNGGFGCDLCVGAEGRLHLAPHPKIFEAPWCCSMRGAEGLARAAQFNMMLDPARRTVWQLFYFEGAYTLRLPEGPIGLQCRSDYPQAGRVEWTVVDCPRAARLTWHFVVPPGVPAGSLVLRQDGRPVELRETAGFMTADLKLTPGAALALDFHLAISVVQPATAALPPGYYRFAHGPLLLGAEQADPASLRPVDDFTALGRGRYQCRRTGTVLGPIDGLTYRSEAEARAHRVQLLFSGGRA
ncbi:MAG: glycoside hydrolase family 127 protein [Lacunisphaera sp.]|nr:glycoside hydrolase family 127 protein [Lacunisphaera sp.]